MMKKRKREKQCEVQEDESIIPIRLLPQQVDTENEEESTQRLAHHRQGPNLRVTKEQGRCQDCKARTPRPEYFFGCAQGLPEQSFQANTLRLFV